MSSKSEHTIWWRYDVSNPKQYTALIKKIVKICRATIEYDYWQLQTKWNAGSDECPLCNTNYAIVRAETHHYPKTLFEVVEEYLQQHINDNDLDTITPLELVEEIMQDHLDMKIDHVVLCKYCHAKYHDMDPDTMQKVEELFKNFKKENNGEQK